MRIYDPGPDMEAATEGAKRVFQSAPGNALDRAVAAVEVLGHAQGLSLRKSRIQSNKDFARRLISRIDRGLTTPCEFLQGGGYDRRTKRILAIAQRVIARRARSQFLQAAE